jgi:hypothetical protein
LSGLAAFRSKWWVVSTKRNEPKHLADAWRKKANGGRPLRRDTAA